ncbi:MAG: hypothetical protein WCV83_03545 [Candidatus Magasanikbacteria bacterium]
MEQKKSFFASLDSKSALIVGLVAGVLVICTVGFLVMLGIYFKGNRSTDLSANVSPVANDGSQQPATPVSVTKSDRPVVELFVMSYCPYGLQMEKAYLPAWNLLKNKADISLKFVSYAMHGLKELEENTRQYCIQQNQPAKISAYLQCFTGKDDYKGCLSQVGITENSLSSCVSATNAKYKTLDKFNDQTTWLSGRYPLYPVNEDLNTKYDVQGSPTLVINGAQVEGVNRTADAVKQAICAAFNTPPAECGQTLSGAAYGAGFGYDTTGNPTAAADCATI